MHRNEDPAQPKVNFKRKYTKNQRKVNETKAGLVKISRKLINVQINWSKEKTSITKLFFQMQKFSLCLNLENVLSLSFHF